MSVYFERVEEKLRSEFKLKVLQETDFPEFHLKLLKINAVNSLLNDCYQLETEELKLHFFQIINNQRSQKYFTEKADYFPVTLAEDESTPILFVIVDEFLGILEANSNQLHMKLLLEQGVTTEDSKSKDLKEHLAIVKASYQEKYSSLEGEFSSVN